jgi:ABC-type amino acid transport substrate-binding protein
MAIVLQSMEHLQRRVRLLFALLAFGASMAFSAAVPAATTGPVAATPAPATMVVPATHASSLPQGMRRTPDGRLLASEIARIVERGELVVAMLGVDTPPFFYTSNGRLVGLEVDMAAAIANELKVKLRVDRQARSFNEVAELVAAGAADLGISKLSRTLARAQTVSFSNPYLTLRHALVINRVRYAELARKRDVHDVIRNFDGSIGVIVKSAFVDYARINFPKARLVEYPGWVELVNAVTRGEVVAAYRDEFEAKRLLQNDPAAPLVLRTVTLNDLEDTLGIAVNVAEPTLLAFVNQYLAQRSEKLDIRKVLDQSRTAAAVGGATKP